jgi:hypothetical protein
LPDVAAKPVEGFRMARLKRVYASYRLIWFEAWENADPSPDYRYGANVRGRGLMMTRVRVGEYTRSGEQSPVGPQRGRP